MVHPSKKEERKGALLGPVYTPKSRWMTSDGVDYRTSNVVPQDGPAGHKQWSDRGFPDDYADNPKQAPGYRKSLPWRGSDFVQDQQSHYYTNPFPEIPWKRWPRYTDNSTRDVDNVPCEIQVGMAGLVQHQVSKQRAPDARWSDVQEAFRSLPSETTSNYAGPPYGPTSVGRSWRLDYS